MLTKPTQAVFVLEVFRFSALVLTFFINKGSHSLEYHVLPTLGRSLEIRGGVTRGLEIKSMGVRKRGLFWVKMQTVHKKITTELVNTYTRHATTGRVGVGLDDVHIDSDDSLGALFSVISDDVSLIEDLESSSVDS